MWFSHDLHQRHPGSVEIDKADLYAVLAAAVDEPAGVLFDVHPCNPGLSRLPCGNELEPPIDCQREIELRNLVSLRQVRVEVVLAVELAERRNRAVERNPRQDRRLDSRFIKCWQCAGETAADHTDERVRGCVGISSRTAAVHLGFREQLGVDFESDDRLVTAAGYPVASCGIGQIGPCPSVLNSVQTAAKFTILHTNQPGWNAAVSSARRGKIAHVAR